MMAADGSVVIEFDADVADVEKKIGRLKTEITNLEEKISEKKFKHNKLQEQVSALRVQVKEATTESERLQSVYAKDPGNEKAENAYRRSAEHVRNLTKELDNAKAAADKLAFSIEEDETNLEAMKYTGGELQAEVNAVESSFSNRLSSGIEKVKDKMESILSKIKSAATKASKLFLSLFKSSNKTNSSFASGIKTMLKYSLGIRGLYALFGKLRSAMTEGFKNLAQYSDSTNKSISVVMSALTQFKNSLSTAFTPILTSVAPILTQFVNMLSTAADYVARLTAALTGQKSYVRAVKVQENYAASLEGTAQAAEDAAGSLAGFDEINTITTENASGGSSGGGVSPSEMFETGAIEPLSFDSWGQAFSAFLDNILNNGIPKLKEGLSTLAGWINTFAANLYEMFTFPGVYDKVAALGTELAYALNGFVNQIDWATIGGALGAGLNLALGFLVSFIYNFDWMNLGASFATMINNTVAEIDWYNVGMFLWAKFKIALETLAGFLLNLDMPQLAQAASNIVIGFFNSMTETVQNIDWSELGRQIVRFIVNIDWAGAFSSAAGALGSIVGAIASFIGGAISEAFTGIYDYFAEAVENCGGDIVGGILTGILSAIVNIGTWIYENIFQPFIDGFKNAFGIHSPSTVMQEQAGYLMDGLKNGITEKIASVIATFTGLKEKIQDVFSHITDWFRDKFSDAWQAVKDVFSSGGQIFDGIKEGILAGLKAVINALISGINKVISIPFNGINSALRTIKNVSILGLKPFSWINTISVPQIPKLAAGAVIPPNREFLAVLGDQASGTNIEAPEDLIRKIVREEAGSGNGEVIALLQAILQATKDGKIIMVGKTVLGRTAAEAINDLTVSSGKPVLLY